MSDLYQEIIIEEFRHPHNFGAMSDADYVIHERNSTCGDEVTMYLKVTPDGRISEVKWEGNGCAISMATMSVLSQVIQNKTFAEIKKMSQKDLEELLGLEEIALGRVKCLTLGFSALKKIKEK